MKQLIKKGLDFIKNNPTIIYSLLLIVVVISALFLNSYFIVTRFQENLDKTLRTKAVLAEEVTGSFAVDYFSDLSNNKNKFEEKIAEIQKSDSEIAEMTVYIPDATSNGYSTLISSKSSPDEQQAETELTKISQNAIKFALSVNDAFAYLSNSKGNRYWNVVKAIRLKDGAVAGVLLMKLSLIENDALVTKTIFQVYLLSMVAVIIVLLLVFNHIRLFTFEIKAKKLEEIDKMKDDFISMASHELKSPLTALRGYIELMTDGTATTDEEKSHYLKNMDLSVERLHTLVEDLLEVSRIEQNRIPVIFNNIKLQPAITQLVDEMRISAKNKSIELVYNPIEIPAVFADLDRVKQVVVNLLSNAIKYTEKGSVTITSKFDNDFVYITFADTGVGMSSGQLKNLFGKFYRISTDKTKNIAGTGLGLWISLQLAKKMRGDILVESMEGVGSHFTLKLPRLEK